MASTQDRKREVPRLTGSEVGGVGQRHQKVGASNGWWRHVALSSVTTVWRVYPNQDLMAREDSGGLSMANTRLCRAAAGL